MRKVIFLLGFSLCVGSSLMADGRWSLADFKNHTLRHKERVPILMLFLNELLPHPLPEEQVMGVGLLHDDAKVSDEPFELQPFGDEAPEESTAISYLHQMAGVNLQILPLESEPRRRARGIIDEINRRDRRNLHAFFRASELENEDGELSSDAETLKRLELIADLVDRGMDPGARREFNRERLEPASEYMRNPTDRHLAGVAEKFYDAIFNGKDAPKLSRSLGDKCALGLEKVRAAYAVP